jgi:hypothetical protein
MKLSPALGVTSCAATQGLPNILWNPKVYYRVHKSSLLVAILIQINSVHTTTSYFFKDLSQYYPLTYVLAFLVVLSFCLSHQYTMCLYLFSIRATCSAHLIVIVLTITIILSEKYKL